MGNRKEVEAKIAAISDLGLLLSLAWECRYFSEKYYTEGKEKHKIAKPYRDFVKLVCAAIDKLKREKKSDALSSSASASAPGAGPSRRRLVEKLHRFEMTGPGGQGRLE